MGAAKKLCCCYWSCCCLVTVIIGIAIAIIATSFEEPEVEVTNAQLSGLNITLERIAFHVDVTVHIDNPNKWPFEASLDKLTAQIWSLDKNDETGEAYYLGDGTLLEPVTIETESETDIELQANPEVEATASNVDLFTRMNRDCGPAVPLLGGGDGTTKLRIKIVEAVGAAAGVDFNLNNLDIEFETEVPCRE